MTGVRCQALSLPRPPVFLGGRPGFRDPCVPGAVGAGVGTQHRPHGGRPCGSALRAVAVAERRPRGGVLFAVVRGVWGKAPPLFQLQAHWAVGVRYPRAVGADVRAWGPCTGLVARETCGGLHATGVAEGVWVQAPPLPCCPPSGRAAGARWPRAVGAGVGVCGVCGVFAVCVVVRGAAFLMSLRCSPLRCFGALWCPAVCCVPAVLPSVRASLARLLATPCFFRGFVALYPFLCPPFSLACTFSLPPPWCVSLSFSSPARLSLSLRPVRQRKGGGM